MEIREMWSRVQERVWVSDVMAGIATCKKIGERQGVRKKQGNKSDVVKSSRTCVWVGLQEALWNVSQDCLGK